MISNSLKPQFASSEVEVAIFTKAAFFSKSPLAKALVKLPPVDKTHRGHLSSDKEVSPQVWQTQRSSASGLNAAGAAAVVVTSGRDSWFCQSWLNTAVRSCTTQE